jgi:hypothetical protein
MVYDKFKEAFMMQSHKGIAYTLVAIFAVLLSAMAVFTACDNRNPLNPSNQQNKQVTEITMFFTPSEIIATQQDEVDTVIIGIQVTDEKGNGIDSLTIDMSRVPNLGILNRPETTGVVGLYQAKYITSPGGFGIVTFTATIGDVAVTDSLRIRYQAVGVVSQISMNFDPSSLIIRSPYKPDTAQIDIWVRDENGSGLDGILVLVRRSPDIGTITPPALTSAGYTQSKYITDPGVYQNVTISITAGEITLIDTLTVTSQLQGEIGNMTVFVQDRSLIADGEDSTAILISVTDTTNIPIGDNTTIFISNYGSSPHRGSLSASSAMTLNGVATFYISSPAILDTLTVVEIDSLKTWGISLSGETTYAYGSLNYIPGPASTLDIMSVPTAMVAGSGGQQSILAIALDASGNRVIDGTQIQFRKQLATSNLTSLATTTRGIATAIYTVGVTSGMDFITAYKPKPNSTDTLWSQTVQLPVRSSLASNITVSAADPTIEIGGIATQINAVLKDENGNPLSDGYLVRFQITNQPPSGGPSFNFVPTPESTLLDVVDSTDVNGKAAVALFSGTRAGTVRVKVTSLDNENVFKEKTVAVITSGPPARIIISPVGNVLPEGQVLIGGVTAMVMDEFTNPVEYNTGVHFEVMPDSVALIMGDAYTGGIIYYPEGDTADTIGTPGLAFTRISYTCDRTFTWVRVVASSGGLVDTSASIQLAFYAEGGRCAVTANPGSIYIPLNVPNPHYDSSAVSCLLLDGIGCPIDRGIINFSAQVAGELCGPSVDTTSGGGWAYTRFRISFDQIPQTPPNPPQVQAKVIAVLQAYPNVKGEATIDCRRP